MKNNKKKGFTLIELIAVIAILAILGAILVPNILAYRKKAEKSNIQSSAKTILSAIDAYNSDKDTAASQIGDSTAGDSADTSNYPGAVGYTAGLSALYSEGTLTETKIPTCLKNSTITSIGALEQVANGKFKVATVNGQDSTIESIGQ